MFAGIGAWFVKILLQYGGQLVYEFFAEMWLKFKRKKAQEEALKNLQEAIDKKMPIEEREKREKDFLNS